MRKTIHVAGEKGTYSVAFKKPKSGRLKWVNTPHTDEMKASRAARDYVTQLHPEWLAKGYREYGISLNQTNACIRYR